MKTAAFVVAAVVVILIDTLASVRVGGSDVLSRSQKTAWLLFVWFAPLIGAVLALVISKEALVPAPVPGTLRDTPNPGIEPEKTGLL